MTIIKQAAELTRKEIAKLTIEETLKVNLVDYNMLLMQKFIKQLSEKKHRAIQIELAEGEAEEPRDEWQLHAESGSC